MIPIPTLGIASRIKLILVVSEVVLKWCASAFRFDVGRFGAAPGCDSDELPNTAGTTALGRQSYSREGQPARHYGSVSRNADAAVLRFAVLSVSTGDNDLLPERSASDTILLADERRIP